MVFQRRTYAVLLVSSSEKFIQATSSLLPPTDYYPVTVTRSAGEARREALERNFDLILINAPLPDEFGSNLAVDLCTTSNAGVLLFVKAEAYEDIYSKVMENGVMVMAKPTSAVMITQSLHIMCAAREKMRIMEQKQATVEEKIKEIRLINRAKWLLIEYMGITEAEAHHYIEKRAMDERISKIETAETIIRTYSR